jgi:hypothetical protein
MKLLSEVVEFRDGTKLTVTEASWQSDILVTQSEKEAARRTDELIEKNKGKLSDDEITRITFNQSIYPKLAACCSGDVPSEDDAFGMPSTEREKWEAAVRKINPQWYKTMDEFVDKMEAAEAALKKSKMTLTESSNDS